MNKWKIYAIAMGFLTFGAMKETFRIFTSNAPDIVNNRMSILPFAICMTIVFLALSIRFWNKSSKPM
jgi:ABC-type glucose/galactose transport system permease subunit